MLFIEEILKKNVNEISKKFQFNKLKIKMFLLILKDIYIAKIFDQLIHLKCTSK